MTNLRKIVAALAVTVMTMPAFAADFGMWSDVGVSKKLGKFTLSLEGGLRLQNNWKNIDRWSVGFGVEYKPVKFLEIGTSYDFLYSYKISSKKDKYDSWQDYDDDGNLVTVTEYEGYNVRKPYWRCRNRWNFDVTGKLDVGRVTLSLRERYQFTRENHVRSDVDKYRIETDGGTPVYTETEVKDREANNESRLRSRLKAEYDIRKCIVTPYAYVEIFNNLRSHMHLLKTRVGAGAEIKLSNHHRLDAGYLYQSSNNDSQDGSTESVIEISYKYKF